MPLNITLPPNNLDPAILRGSDEDYFVKWLKAHRPLLLSNEPPEVGKLNWSRRGHGGYKGTRKSYD